MRKALNFPKRDIKIIGRHERNIQNAIGEVFRDAHNKLHPIETADFQRISAKPKVRRQADFGENSEKNNDHATVTLVLFARQFPQ